MLEFVYAYWATAVAGIVLALALCGLYGQILYTLAQMAGTPRPAFRQWALCAVAIVGLVCIAGYVFGRTGGM